MSPGTVRSVDLRRYFGPREPMLDEILRTSLLEHRMPTIQVDDNAARVLQMLTALHRPAHVVEIGTLFGWSTLHLARGLPPGGRITSFEVDPAAAELARNNLRRAALADRVEVVVGDAVPALRALEPQSVDLVFIDGDKRAYLEYLKAAVPLLPPGGLLVADDALAEGDFSGEAVEDDAAERAAVIRRFSRAVCTSPLFEACFIGTEAGLLVARRRTES